MRSRSKVLLGLTGGALVAGGLALPVFGEGAADERGKVALAQWYGRESAVDYEAWVVARDQEALKRVWVAHYGPDAVGRAAQGWVQAPEVDFDRCMVVGVFNGERTNCNGERLVSVEEKGDHVLVRYDSITFQTMAMPGDVDEGDSSTPWGLFLVPWSDKTVVIEENTQGLIGGPPVWTERARIGWPHAKGGWFVPGARGEQGE